MDFTQDLTLDSDESSLSSVSRNSDQLYISAKPQNQVEAEVSPAVNPLFIKKNTEDEEVHNQVQIRSKSISKQKENSVSHAAEVKDEEESIAMQTPNFPLKAGQQKSAEYPREAEIFSNTERSLIQKVPNKFSTPAFYPSEDQISEAQSENIQPNRLN